MDLLSCRTLPEITDNTTDNTRDVSLSKRGGRNGRAGNGRPDWTRNDSGRKSLHDLIVAPRNSAGSNGVRFRMDGKPSVRSSLVVLRLRLVGPVVF
jgi:hypothetical protein